MTRNSWTRLKTDAQEQQKLVQGMRTESLKSKGHGHVPTDGVSLTAEQIPIAVEDVLTATQSVDIHTHLYPLAFGKIGLWGIAELLTYHYLEAEFFRSSFLIPRSSLERTNPTEPGPGR
jgi:hypothetical protein